MDISFPEQRPVGQAMRRGFMGKCPSCGAGRLFRKYLKVQDHCPKCNEDLHHQQTDDAPAYFTILIVGHILVPIALVVETTYSPSVAFSIGVWVPAIIISCLALLPRIKGALVGFQWSRRMHGFGDEG
jgi:uncharacterized protein (DUF983 family)